MHPTVKKLTCLLLLLALFAAGQASMRMAMPMAARGQVAADALMPDINCEGCGKASTTSSCEALCAALSAVVAATIGLDQVPARLSWPLSSESGSTHIVSPDTSPPRA